MTRRKRTKREFKKYNDYDDRGKVKWETAFAMEELMNGINKNSKESMKVNMPLSQMNRQEIDAILADSYLYDKVIEIQLNLRDNFGRLVDNITGKFLGEAYEDYFVVDDQRIFWEDVRHISVPKKDKWFNVEMFSSDTTESKGEPLEQVDYEKNEFYQEFYD